MSTKPYLQRDREHRRSSSSSQPVESVARWALRLLIVLLLLLPGVTHVWAQRGPWNMPIALALSGPEYKTGFPEIASDVYGMVHVVTSRSHPLEGSEIVYTMWDGTGWQAPIDIVAGREGRSVWPEKLDTTNEGLLYLLWIAQGDGLYLSHVPVASAGMVPTWDTVWVASRATSGDMVIHGAEHMAVVYINNGREVLFQETQDGGSSWDGETLIWAPPTANQASRNVRMIADDAGVYHVVWTETDAELDWNPSGIWYARSMDGGRTWQDFYHVPDQGSYVNVFIDREGTVHLLWDRNVGTVDGRYHTWSNDGGRTWQEPKWIMEGLSGRTGYPRMILDSNGTLHQITAGAGKGRKGGIYHAIWSEDRWSAPALVSPDVREEGHEGPALTITSGNHLHVVWLNWATHDIMYANYRSEAPEVMGPTSSPVPLFAGAPVATGGYSGATKEEQVSLVPEAQETPGLSFGEPQADPVLPYLSIVMGLIPPTVLLLIVIFWHRARS
mgnify:FL=1